MLRKFVVIFIILTIIAVLIPAILWNFDEETELNMLIIDKTVPDQTFREHQGLTWLLNHNKIVKKDSKDRYDTREDYFGFVPLDNFEYEVRNLPEDMSKVDIFYIADTYGVYHDDFYGGIPSTEHSEMIYGGLFLEEMEAIKNTLYQSKATLIAEFNSFASPTSKDARESLTALLSIYSTEWIGRYFVELDPSRTDEIPQWVIKSYETQTGRTWNYEKGGFLLVHEDGTIVVLEDTIHVGNEGIKAIFTKSGQEMFGIADSPQYNYWFDIVIPHNEEDVLAYYQWDLTEAGLDILREFNIPAQFPAVTKSISKGFPAYYFAGDYADVASIPTFYQYKGLAFINKFFSYKLKNSEDAFFWNTYIPMMESILASTNQYVEEKENHIYLDGETMYSSKINENSFQYFHNGEWKEMLIKGVNLGIASPGAWPGEAAITEDEYYRWFEYIGQMNANTIRVYTMHPPDFYRALERYNRTHEQALFLFHGIWIEDENLDSTLDAFDPINVESFKEEISRVIDVIHGNAVLKERPGHASGNYTANISPYVIGWILGIEWYPIMVENTNLLHSNLGEYEGKHVFTKNAQPFEYWMADIFDFTLDYEWQTYRWQRPISFTNWVTTDLLTHPSEPFIEEDLVKINPNVIQLKEHIKTGQFASYHVYPYYPDFLNLEPDYINFVDHQGEKNNYAAYLRDLHQAHTIPILIAEFGVPGSRGLTHENPFGWNQGFLTEKEQGETTARLFEDIVHEGLLGGLVFSWHDEWFKPTWNTSHLDSSDRRPYWSDAQTNEQNFGLMSFDQLKIKVDGSKDDWLLQNSIPLYQKESDPIYLFHDGHDESRSLRGVYMEYDERYLYLRIDYEAFNQSDPFNDMHTLVLFDTIPNQGNTKMPFYTNVETDTGIDFVIHLNGKNSSRILVDSYYDIFYYQNAYEFSYIERKEYANEKENGIFHPIHLTLNREMTIPTTNEVIPFHSYETGKLRHGNANPESEQYDSLADFYVNTDEAFIEIRLPWLLLNIKDPSSKVIIGDMWQDGLTATQILEDIGIAVITYKPDHDGHAVPIAEGNSMNMTDSFPTATHNMLLSRSMERYSWREWDTPHYEERLKQSYYILQEAFKND